MISNYLKREKTVPKVPIPPTKKRNIFKGRRSRKRRRVQTDNSEPKAKKPKSKIEPPKLVSSGVDVNGSENVDLQNVSYFLL